MTVRLVSKFRELVRQEGLLRALSRVPASLGWRLARYRDDIAFDRKYGVETSTVESEYLNSVKSEYVADSEFYQATSWRHFKKMMKAMPIDHADFIFIDAGCGKGRALMFASLFAFKRIIGIEFSDRLVEIARRNMAKFSEKAKTRSEVEIQCTDIALFELPMGNLLIYLYNPFYGELMKLFIEKVGKFVDGNPFQVYIAYRNPVCSEMFEEQPFLETLTRNQVYAVYRSRHSS